MTTKRSLVFALVFSAATTSITTHAETFQWKDSNGQTVISDLPPPSTVKGRRSLGGQQPSVVSEKLPEKPADGAKPSDAPKTTAEKDMDFKKRQQEAKEKADKQVAENEKRENCERAKRNLAAVESSQPMVTFDDKGERQMMDTSAREYEKERARKIVADACK